MFALIAVALTAVVLLGFTATCIWLTIEETATIIPNMVKKMRAQLNLN